MMFNTEFQFAELHMPAVRRALGALPARMFFNIQTAPLKRDMEQATDLILTVTAGDIAVRVRRNKFWQKASKFGGFDWSVRAINKGFKTEIHKLREGFARWYFMSFSGDDRGSLADWWLIDMDTVRQKRLLDRQWKTYPNGDGTAGMYIPVMEIYQIGGIVAEMDGADNRLSTQWKEHGYY
jgi:hypothetical protein